MSIEVQQLRKNFGDFKAVDNVSLSIKSGELTALLGPSGSGKTTLLRLIAGLEQADSGRILFNEEDISDRHVSERGVGFGLSVKPKKFRPSNTEIKQKVQKLLELVQLDWTADRYPSQLSGGQRQRIALARALAVEPKVLLLDEPFGALDAKVRAELRRWLRRLHDEIHVTSVFVTHDQEEALEVADRIVVMNKGRVEQDGTPEQVYDHPANPFVYEFLGTVNLFHARVRDGDQLVQPSSADLPAAAEQLEQPGLAYVRPHEIDVLHAKEEDAIAARLDLITVVGPTVRLELQSQHADQIIHVELDKTRFKQLGLSVGQHTWLKPRYSRVFLGEGI